MNNIRAKNSFGFNEVSSTISRINRTGTDVPRINVCCINPALRKSAKILRVNKNKINE